MLRWPRPGEVIDWSTTIRRRVRAGPRRAPANHGPSGRPDGSWGTNDRGQPIEKLLSRFNVFLVEEVERRIIDRSVVGQEQRGIL